MRSAGLRICTGAFPPTKRRRAGWHHTPMCSSFLQIQLYHCQKYIVWRIIPAYPSVQKTSVFQEEMNLPSGIGCLTTINRIPWTFSYFSFLFPLWLRVGKYLGFGLGFLWRVSLVIPPSLCWNAWFPSVSTKPFIKTEMKGNKYKFIKATLNITELALRAGVKK